jgi:hypothetical protein
VVCSRGDRVVDIALAAHDMTGPLRCRFELCAIDYRVATRIGAEIPSDLEFLATLLGRPSVGCNDGNAAQWIEARRNRVAGIATTCFIFGKTMSTP